MIFAKFSHRVGVWALPALINGDTTGMDEQEERAFDQWHDVVTQSWSDADDNTWVFAHWGVSDVDDTDFATDEITGLKSDTTDVIAHYITVRRDYSAITN